MEGRRTNKKPASSFPKIHIFLSTRFWSREIIIRSLNIIIPREKIIRVLRININSSRRLNLWSSAQYYYTDNATVSGTLAHYHGITYTYIYIHTYIASVRRACQPLRFRFPTLPTHVTLALNPPPILVLSFFTPYLSASDPIPYYV